MRVLEGVKMRKASNLATLMLLVGGPDLLLDTQLEKHFEELNTTDVVQ